MSNEGKSRAIVLINLFTIIIGIVVMAGWVFHIPVFKQIVPGFVFMVFNTAVCFILFSIALLSTLYPANKYRDALYFTTSCIGTLIGLITLLQFLFNFNTGLDELFVKDPTPISAAHLYAGRMAFNTAVTVVLFGAGLLLISSRKHLFVFIGQYLFHAVSIITSVALIGYLFGVSLFHSLLYVSSMATHTAILFFLLSVAASLLNPTVGITSLFTGKQIGNIMARRLFGLTVLLVVICGSVRLQIDRYSMFSSDIGVSLLVICFLLTSLVIIWNTAIWLNGIDLKRSQAEAEVKRMNAELEKRVEERSAEIQKSEAKYRSLISQASDAIYLLDLNGNFIDVNDSMCVMIGYSSDELLKMHVTDIIDRQELKNDPLLSRIELSKQSVIRERRFRRKDGSIFTAEVNVKIFPDNGVLVMARDISDRKKMETELREAELKFRTIADKSIVGVYILQCGKFIYLNPRFAEIFGYEADELIGTDPVNTIIHENYRHIAKENIRKRIEGELQSIQYEAMGAKKDGSTNWVEFYGSSVLINGERTIIGTMLDVTERKEAENLILKEKILSDTIINSLPGIFYLLTDDGRYLRWNYNLERIMGYKAEEIEHLNMMQLVAPEDHQLVVETIEKVFIDGYSMVEAHGVTKDGKRIPFLLTGIPILYEGQRCLLGTGIDISLRIKAEEELRSSEQKYKLLFENSPLPLWMITKDDLTIIAANNAAARLYEYTRDELINKSITLIRAKDDRERALTRSEESLTNVTDLGIVRHEKKDGTQMFINIIAQDIIFEGREVRLSFTNDVTERLKAEESLRKSEANLKTILDTTDTAYALLDMQFKVLAFNQKAIEFVQINYNHVAQKGDLLSDYFPHERFPQFLDFIGEVMKGNSINYEIDYPQMDGTVFWYDVHLSPIIDDNKKILGMLMALYDITERKENEQNLRNAYDRIQDHVESIKHMAWKQSHLMRSPLANLKALADILKWHPTDDEAMQHFQAELARMDAIIHEMAQEASEHDR
jgi:PAS domain S-box-containing protein